MSKKISRFLAIILFFILESVRADLIQNTTSDVVSSPDITMSLLKVTGGLLMVILTILGSAWLFRYFSKMSPIANDALKIIGGISMGQKERVVLLQVGDEQILLGISAGNIRRLHVLKNNIEISTCQSTTEKSFSNQLKMALQSAPFHTSQKN